MSCSISSQIENGDLIVCIEDCYLILKNPDGLAVCAYPLCNATVKPSPSGGTRICLADGGVVNLPNSALEGIDLVAEVIACKVSLENIGNIELDVAKFGQSTERWCSIATGEECEITKCYDAGVYTYHDSETNTTYSQMDFNGSFEKCGSKKKFIDTVFYTDNLETVPDKLKTPIAIDRYLSPDGSWCYVLCGEPIAADESNLLTIENYTKMANTPGYPGAVIPENSTGIIPYSFCGPFTGTLADLLTELALDADFDLDGTTPDGLIHLTVYGEPKGSICKGVQLTAGGSTVGTRSVDGGEGWCKTIKYEDKDCDRFAECIDLTTVLDIPAGAGVVGEANGVMCDSDDKDGTVQ